MYPSWRFVHGYAPVEAKASLPSLDPSHSQGRKKRRLTSWPNHRKLGDHTYLSWNNAPAGKGPSTGVASGRDLGPQGQA